MGRELRRRLQEVDPNLTIIFKRRDAARRVRAVPRVLKPEEARQWGLPEMIPVFPPENIITAESKHSKKQLQQMARRYFLDPGGDKQALVEKLMYIGAMDEEGSATGLSTEPKYAPYIVDNPKRFCCRICGACAPPDLLKQGQFFERMAWLRQHYKTEHPGKWGER